MKFGVVISNIWTLFYVTVFDKIRKTKKSVEEIAKMRYYFL